MQLSTEQKFIRLRMIGGAVTAVMVIPITWWISNFIKVNNVLWALAISSILTILPMIVMIGVLAGIRFFSAGIDGSNIALIDVNVRVLNNTHEQTLLFLVANTVLAVTLPMQHFAMLIFLALVFALGRILFWQGYKKNTIARAYGFAINFYGSIVILIFALCRLMLYFICVK